MTMITLSHEGHAETGLLGAGKVQVYLGFAQSSVTSWLPTKLIFLLFLLCTSQTYEKRDIRVERVACYDWFGSLIFTSTSVQVCIRKSHGRNAVFPQNRSRSGTRHYFIRRSHFHTTGKWLHM